MENLNAEQVKSDLAICALGDCQACHYNKFIAGCRDELCGDALALINSQEQRIKELTEENERLTADKDYWQNRAKESESEYDQAVKRGYEYGTVDSVRAFVEKLKKSLYDTPTLFTQQRYIVNHIIDQIAKEMIGE